MLGEQATAATSRTARVVRARQAAAGAVRLLAEGAGARQPRPVDLPAAAGDAGAGRTRRADALPDALGDRHRGADRRAVRHRLGGVARPARSTRSFTGFAMLGASVPSFWFGLMLMQIFAVASAGSRSRATATRRAARRRACITWCCRPSCSASLNSALIIRFTRAEHARRAGRGLRAHRARQGPARSRAWCCKHALRNALIPIVTVIGLTVALLIGGAVVTETVFGLPGVGNLVVSRGAAPRLPGDPGRAAGHRGDLRADQLRDRPALRRGRPAREATEAPMRDPPALPRLSGAPRPAAILRQLRARADRRCVVLAIIARARALAPWIAPYDPKDATSSQRLQSPRRDALVRHRRARPRRLLARDLRRPLFAADRRAGGRRLDGLRRRCSGWSPASSAASTAPVMRLVDAMMSFPDILLAIALVAILGPSMINVVLALAIVYTPRVARVVRASTLVVRELLFVEAARALGISTWRILCLHVLQNLLSPILVQAHVHLRLRDPGRGRPVVPRRRRAAGDADLGHDDRERPAVRAPGVLARRSFPASRSSSPRSRCRWSATAFATCSIQAEEGAVSSTRRTLLRVQPPAARSSRPKPASSGRSRTSRSRSTRARRWRWSANRAPASR